MHKKISSLVFAVLLLSLGLVSWSCQSKEDKASLTQEKPKEAYAAQTATDQSNTESETDKQIREYVDSTPDLYRVSWKVCGDKKLNVTLRSKINNECNETRNEPTKGYIQPAYVWGPAEEVTFINKPHFALSLQKTGLFVKSRGCVNLGKPQEEKFYKVEEFSLNKGNKIAATNAKLELVTKQEKEEILSAVLKDAELDTQSLNNFGVASNGLIPTGKNCPTIEEWKNQN